MFITGCIWDVKVTLSWVRKVTGSAPRGFRPKFHFLTLPVLSHPAVDPARLLESEAGSWKSLDRAHPGVRVTHLGAGAVAHHTQADGQAAAVPGVPPGCAPGSSLWVRATDWAASARAPLNCAPREETKKKKNTTKPSLREGGFKRLRKPPTVKLCTGAQTVSRLAPVHPCGHPAQPRCGSNTPSCPQPRSRRAHLPASSCMVQVYAPYS